MTGFWAVIKKDWRSYFWSQFAYIVLGVYSFIMGLYFTVLVYAYMRNSARGGMGMGDQTTLEMVTNSLLHANSYILAFMTPIITMRMFAEEKRQQTFELLFTSPIRLGELVLAKFVAVFGLVAAMLGVTALYYVFLFAWGNPELNVTLSGLLGLLLLMMTYVALGGLISSFCSSQAIAAIFGYILLLVLWILPSIGGFLYFKVAGVEMGPFLTYLTPQGHFKPFVDGVIHAKHVWFYLSSTAFLLFLTAKTVESNRWR